MSLRTKSFNTIENSFSLGRKDVYKIWKPRIRLFKK